MGTIFDMYLSVAVYRTVGGTLYGCLVDFRYKAGVKSHRSVCTNSVQALANQKRNTLVSNCPVIMHKNILNRTLEVAQWHAIAGDLFGLQLPDHMGTDFVHVLLPVDHCVYKRNLRANLSVS